MRIAATALAIALPSAASAQALILRAAGPSAPRFPPGTRTQPGAVFNLRPGDELSILTGGSTRTFHGPGSFSATGPLAGGTAAATVRRNTGAVRSAEEEMSHHRRTSIWQYDVTTGGHACVLAGHPLVLWRPNANNAVQLTITSPAGAPRTVAWQAGRDTVSWPDDLPTTAGSYQLAWTGGSAPVRIVVQSLSGLNGEDMEAVAAAFVANRCDNQIQALTALLDHDANDAAASARQ